MSECDFVIVSWPHRRIGQRCIPGKPFAILSRDPDFVADMSLLRRSSHAEVYVATSWEELDTIRSEVVFEILLSGTVRQ